MKDDFRFFAKALFVGILIFVIAFLDGRVAKGGLTVVLALVCLWGAMTNKRGTVLSCFILFPVLQTLNPLVFSSSSLGSIVNRLSMFILSLVMAFTATRSRGSNRLPLGGMFFYLLLAVVSSMQGYCPMVSYAKLINFSAFMIGIWLGTRNLQNSPKDLAVLRVFLMGLCVFFIVGSAVLLPFPGYAYLNLRSAAAMEGAEYAAELYADLMANDSIALFAGVTNQSQCLGPMLAAANVWIICDMLFVIKRFEKYHVGLIVLGLVLMIMTHSRTSLVAFLAGGMILLFYVLKRVPMSRSVKRRVTNVAYIGAVLAFAWVAHSEIRHGSATKWMLKYDTDTSNSFMTNVTHSRQGLIEQNWRDYDHNHLLGCGFQVSWYHAIQFAGKGGLVLSAPIEKGVLPLMVLGEGGIIGLAVFIFFILSFYAGCIKSKHYTTILLFTVMIGSNMGEADFFSPGGIGGAKWVMCVVGGFIIDTLLLYQRKVGQNMMIAGVYNR